MPQGDLKNGPEFSHPRLHQTRVLAMRKQSAANNPQAGPASGSRSREAAWLPATESSVSGIEAPLTTPRDAHCLPGPQDDMHDEAPPVRYAETRFDHADQLAFAAWSGDRNPLHVDPLAARRLVAGKQVVHGVHVALRALESWPDLTSLPAAGLTIDFANPVCIDDVVEFDCQRLPQNVTRLRGMVRGQPTTYIDLVPESTSARSTIDPVDCRPMDTPADPVDLQTDQWVGQCVRLRPAGTGLPDAYPRCTQWLGPHRVDALGLLSFVVGMVCPGMHSIFASLNLSWADEPSNDSELRIKVTRFDKRFQIFLIDFEGCVQGRIKAFQRPKPQTQPRLADLRAVVNPEEFRGHHAWVIGGSRGLGELTAKLVAAGGGSVTITYAKGADEARQVAGDINAWRPDQACVCPLDVSTEDFNRWVRARQLPSAVFYFATPPILSQRSSGFDADLFNGYNTFYVSRFHALCEALSGVIGDGRACLFYPSSVMVHDRPRGFVEYAMSKAAAELLIHEWNGSSKNLSIIASRLPRLATDQTATVHALPHEDNIKTMLPLVRTTLAAGRHDG